MRNNDAQSLAFSLLAASRALVDGVSAGVRARGFSDVRPAHGFAFTLLSAGGATIDGQSGEAAAGDVILVPAGARFSVGNPAGEPAAAWVTTSVGFAGVLPDGSWITPPWTQ